MTLTANPGDTVSTITRPDERPHAAVPTADTAAATGSETDDAPPRADVDATTGHDSEPVGELLRVDPRTLVIGANVRRDVVLDRPFLRSISDRGVREPIIVRRDDHGVLVVRKGKRRTLAAVETGRPTVPVFGRVRPARRGPGRRGPGRGDRPDRRSARGEPASRRHPRGRRGPGAPAVARPRVDRGSDRAAHPRPERPGEADHRGRAQRARRGDGALRPHPGPGRGHRRVRRPGRPGRRSGESAHRDRGQGACPVRARRAAASRSARRRPPGRRHRRRADQPGRAGPRPGGHRQRGAAQRAAA
ncbi:ParB N-terminal domain-containing protein [Pseudonocardia petroleophila]|uniref:ParB N-terminal domain-containing protein n=1 Tax=Pseudonocardia petroleophila TaxID=37331 RepID=A0A7G7MSE7_9PSEU|nr:ParB N-terminal domain-containing protein [Pseudonocardia petroleophila]